MSRTTENAYRKIDRLSYSDLSLFSKSRSDYYFEKILKDETFLKKKKETFAENRDIILGNLVDCLKTDKENYNKLFYESLDLPSPEPQVKRFYDILFTYVNDEDTTFVDKCKRSYEELKMENGGKLRSNFDTFLSNATTKGMYYYDMLLESGNKTIIYKKEYDIANKIVDMINQCPSFGNKGMEVINKLVVLYDYDQHQMKSEIDEIAIDHKNKIIYLYDYKTTFSPEHFISLSYLKRNYYIQASLYKYGLSQWALEHYPKYKIENMTFKVTDSSGYLKPLLYKTTDEHYIQGFNGFYHNNKYYKGIDELLEELTFATTNNIWDISYINHKSKNIITIPIFKNDK